MLAGQTHEKEMQHDFFMVLFVTKGYWVVQEKTGYDMPITHIYLLKGTILSMSIY